MLVFGTLKLKLRIVAIFKLYVTDPQTINSKCRYVSQLKRHRPLLSIPRKNPELPQAF